MADMKRVRERHADPTLFTDAAKRAAKVEARLRATPVNLMALRLQDTPDPSMKMYWLRKATDTLGWAMQGIAPCRDRCDACCHMATSISLDEAKTISEATGHPMVVPPDLDEMQKVEFDRIKYKGVPCVFLKDRRCSIYEHRPHACRVHYSVDRDNLLCQIVPEESIRVPSYDNTKFNLLYLLAHEGDPRDITTADIRDFFPPNA